MKCALLVIGLLTAIPRPSAAAWSNIPVVNFPDRVSSMTFGKVAGIPTLMLASRGVVHMVSWNGTDWRKSSLPLPSRGKTSIAYIPGRNDGIYRLYAGIHNDSNVYEFSPGASGWTTKSIPLSGIGSDELRAAISAVDGRERIYVNRMYKGPALTNDGTCGHTALHHKLWELSWRGNDFETELISEPCGGPFEVNPRGERDFDVIVGLFRTLVRRNTGGWENIGRYSGFRYMSASQAHNNVVFTDARTTFSEDFLKQTHMPLRANGTIGVANIISLAPGRARDDGRERVYEGGEDHRVYELEAKDDGWTAEVVGAGPGVPWRLLPADLRGEGRDRIYAAHDRALVEYAYFPEALPVAVLGFNLVTANSEASAGGERAISAFFRAELGRYGHLDVLETDDIEKILDERDFQFSQCKDAACLAKVGVLLKARAVVTGTLKKQDRGIVVNLRVVDSTSQRLILELHRPAKNELEILSTIRILAEETASRWPRPLKK